MVCLFTRSAHLYDLLHAHKDYAGETARLRQVIAEQKHSTGNSLLEVACGTGRYLELLQPHFRVAGLDLDPAMLTLATDRLPGVPLYQGDMTDFALEQRYDVVVCLFGSIAYVRYPALLRQAVAAMARHTVPGGLVVVEPWLGPDQALPGHVGAVFINQPDLKVARMRVSRIEEHLSILDFHYLVATPSGVEHFTERHELGIFTAATYRAAFEAAGLQPWHNPHGLSGWGLFGAVRP